MRRSATATAALEQTAWAVARRLPSFGYSEIAVEVRIGHEKATEIVRGWQSKGLVELVSGGIGKRNLFRVLPGAELPVPPTGRTPEENLWSAMRGLKTFRPTDLAAHATTEAVKVGPDEALAYCRSLLAAGYLAVSVKAVPGQREAIYRLVRNTGPRPPQERRVRAVVDPNLDEIVVIGGPNA